MTRKFFQNRFLIEENSLLRENSLSWKMDKGSSVDLDEEIDCPIATILSIKCNNKTKDI